MIPIEDLRETICWIPARRAVEAALPLIGIENLRGIRKIVLVDRGGLKETVGHDTSLYPEQEPQILLYFIILT